MKKILMVTIALIAVFTVKAQTIAATTSAGFGILRHDNYRTGYSPVTMVGLEFNDRFGLEYGYSWGLNDDTKQLINYLYGTSKTYVAGHFTNIYGMYFKTERNENTGINLGFGVSSTSLYKAENDVVVDRELSPYFKVGLDHKFHRDWSATLNAGLGQVTMLTFGIVKRF
jgi:hypothetical protein